jgi:hypothetical protein
MRGRTKSLPAPIGGLNARDGIDNMPPLDAVRLDNWFPTTASVNLRNGYKSGSSGLGANVETLATYNSTTGSQMFGAAGANIYDLSAGGAVGAAVVTGQTSARWQDLNFGSTAANKSFLYLFNGVDSPQLYDGTAWLAVTAVSAIAITGVDPKLLIQAVSFKQRIYMVEKNSFRCWYLPVNSLGGAAQSLEFGGLFKLGGYLMAVASWSVDNTAGLQEFFVAISSEGEVAVYQGYDPTAAANWSIASHFRIGRPIGRRCCAKVGSDVIIITADGAFPLSKALMTDRSDESPALSQKIQDLINTDVQIYSANFGWQIILYPIGNKIIVNVPYQAGAASYQYVMNTITKAWCRFTGWNALCWTLFNDKIYFGTTGGLVYQADTGSNDNGANIVGDALQAFSNFDIETQKQFTGMRPVLNASSGIAPACAINADFDTTSPSAITSSAISVTPWGSPWGSPWSTNNATIRVWHGATGIGYKGAPAMVVSAKNAVCKWQSTDVLFEPCRVSL